MRYDVILSDNPWAHNDRRVMRLDGKKPRFGIGANNKYQTMSTDDLCSLPIQDIAATPSVLFLWATFPMLPDALRVMEAWGYKFSTIGFLWIKLNSGRLNKMDYMVNMLRGEGVLTLLDWLRFYGVGFWTRSNPEPCLLGTRGKPVLHPIRAPSSILFAPKGLHSEKPLEVAERITQMFGPDRDYLELFARRQNYREKDNWTATGLEYDDLDIQEAIKKLTLV